MRSLILCLMERWRWYHRRVANNHEDQWLRSNLEVKHKDQTQRSTMETNQDDQPGRWTVIIMHEFDYHVPYTDKIWWRTIKFLFVIKENTDIYNYQGWGQIHICICIWVKYKYKYVFVFVFDQTKSVYLYLYLYLYLTSVFDVFGQIHLKYT